MLPLQTNIKSIHKKKLYQNNEGVDDVKKHARAKFDNKENMQGGKKKDKSACEWLCILWINTRPNKHAYFPFLFHLAQNFVHLQILLEHVFALFIHLCFWLIFSRIFWLGFLKWEYGRWKWEHWRRSCSYIGLKFASPQPSSWLYPWILPASSSKF